MSEHQETANGLNRGIATAFSSRKKAVSELQEMPKFMRGTAPEGFDVAAFYKGIYTFQAWEIFPGHHVPGAKPVRRCLELLDVPERLDGARVLEIAPWNGFFGFELLRRGARELVALGPENPEQTGFRSTVDLLEINGRVRYIKASIYDIAKHELGSFDIVMCLGLIYHLRHPLLALDLLHDHCHARTMFLVDSATIDDVCHISEEHDRQVMRKPWKAVSHIPLTTFVRGSVDAPLSVDAYNWFVPNSVCLRAWVISSGFEVDHEYIDNTWMWIKARPVERPFAVGLEGFNPAVSVEES